MVKDRRMPRPKLVYGRRVRDELDDAFSALPADDEVDQHRDGSNPWDNIHGDS